VSLVKQDHQDTYVCPFVDQCNCQVKFRIYAAGIYASDIIIKLETQGEHTAESHVQDKATKFLTVSQSAAIEQTVSTNSTASATAVLRGLELLLDPVAKVSPSKQRFVHLSLSKAQDRRLQPFTQGERLEGDEGSHNCLSKKSFLRTLVEEHKAGGKHLDLHQSVCVGYQYSDVVIFAPTQNRCFCCTRAVASMLAGLCKPGSMTFLA
jgi:hypothetical protein